MVRAVAAQGLALCVLAGCSLGELAAGQLSLVNDQVRLSQAIAAEPDPARKRLLQEVPEILSFARERLGLDTGGSYRGYYATARSGMTYVLTASRRLSFTPYSWWFPIAGTIEYRSYWDEEDARGAARELEAAGYDTWVSPSRAYSTLGWLRDPVATTMLRDGMPGLVEVLLHELSHAWLYVPGHTDWNEAFASFVGERGAELYFARAAYAGTALAAGREARARRRRELDELVAGACAVLQQLYGSQTPEAEILREREPVFDALARALARLHPEDDPVLWRVNNARLVHFRRYSAHTARMRELWRRGGGRFRPFLALAAADARRLD